MLEIVLRDQPCARDQPVESIPSGWNFRIKTDQHGQLKRRKARFFAKGYRQVKGIDFQESFAPVVRYDSLRVVLEEIYKLICF